MYCYYIIPAKGRQINQEQVGPTENNTVGSYLYGIKGTSYSRKFSLQGKVRK